MVINITPKAPREPYIAAEAASFNTVTLSISLGLRFNGSPATPSIKTVGSFFTFSPSYLDSLKYRSEHPGTLPEVTVDPATGRYVYYGNTNWLKELYVDNVPSMEHSLSVSGGGDKVDVEIKHQQTVLGL